MTDVSRSLSPAVLRDQIKNNRLARTGLLIAFAVIVADQISKWIILGPMGFSPEGCLEAALAHQPTRACGHMPISSVFDLSMVWNTGVSFGMFSASSIVGRVLLIVFALGLSGVLTVWLFRSHRALTATALGFVIGGALGNVIDRARFGAVVDFFDFSGPWFGWIIGGWPVGFPFVFNVADAAINVGVALLITDWILEERRAKAAGAPGQT